MEKALPISTLASTAKMAICPDDTIIMVPCLETDSSDDDEDLTGDENDDMRVCVHCRRCFMSNVDLVPHCINTHFCDPACFDSCKPALYERHNLLKSYRSLGLTVRALGRFLKLKKCEECPKVFVCHFDIVAHAVRVHSTYTPYGCVTCEQKFDTIWSRAQHMRKVHAQSKVPCKVCGESVSAVHGIEAHVVKCSLKSQHQSKLQGYKAGRLDMENRRKRRSKRIAQALETRSERGRPKRLCRRPDIVKSSSNGNRKRKRAIKNVKVGAEGKTSKELTVTTEESDDS